MVYASLLNGLKNTKIELVMSIVLLMSAGLIACNMEKVVEPPKESVRQEAKVGVGRTVIIDSGHGGVDPGKIGVNKILEKDINLEIALKLEEKLKSQGFNVVMTRVSDEGLYPADASNKKMADMRRRCQIVNNTYAKHPDAMLVSIHQNSFTSESVHGAQVFYYINSDKAKEFATIMQEKLNENININNIKQAKENTNYYLLLHTGCPAVIVECGFLSNWKDANNLATFEYQERIATVIYEGILKCMEQ